MALLKQSSAYAKMVLLIDSADHISGLASATLTITLSKAGGAFNTITPTVTDRGSGWYSLALTSSHTDTLGELALHITATSADPTDPPPDQVTARGIDDLAFPTTSGRSLDVSATGEAGLDFDNVKQASGATTLSNITVPTVTAVTTDVGITQAAADKAWATATRALTDKANFTLSSAGVQAIWDALTSALTTSGSVGKLLVDNLNAAVGTVSTNVTTLLNRLGAFSGSGLNTVLGFFRALLRKDAALTPSDVAGTFDNTTDSLEAQQESGAGGGLADWSSSERQQIRQALGVTGSAAATTGSGNLDGVKTKTDQLAFSTANEVDANVLATASKALPGGTVSADGGNTATTFKTSRTESATDYWKDTLILLTSGALDGQIRRVSAYDGTTKFVTVSSALTGIPATGVSFVLINR